MFGRIRHIAVLFVLLFALASCDKTIHEYPGTNNIQLTVECSVDLAHPEHFVTVECDAENGTSYVVRTQSIGPLGTRFTEPVCLRYIIDLYRVTASHSTFVERRVCFADVDDRNPQAIETFDVYAAEYKVLIWCDYVQDDVRESWYYQTDDLRKILYSDIEVVDNNDKDAFTNAIDVDLKEYYYMEGDFHIVKQVDLERPKGRYKCITTDIRDYLKSDDDVQEITSVITYTQYVSAGYNVEDQKPNYFEPTRTYVTHIDTSAQESYDEDGNLELCYDYVFVNGKQTNVKINFYFYKGRPTINEQTGEVVGEEISHWSGIVVPLKRNMETVVEGRMLTTSFGTGGIGIDPGFEDEIVIPVGD